MSRLRLSFVAQVSRFLNEFGHKYGYFCRYRMFVALLEGSLQIGSRGFYNTLQKVNLIH